MIESVINLWCDIRSVGKVICQQAIVDNAVTVAIKV